MVAFEKFLFLAVLVFGGLSAWIVLGDAPSFMVSHLMTFAQVMVGAGVLQVLTFVFNLSTGRHSPKK